MWKLKVKKTKLFSSLVLLLLGFLIGCEEIDDQTIAKGKEWQAANPRPETRNFILNNQNHKILVAEIDSGVDYNHPLLKNNIHFNLDSQGKPIGFGYDFVGQDYWSSPYVARTLDLNPEAKLKDAESTRRGRMMAEEIVKSDPALGIYLDPSRNVQQEIESGAYHGTHVAGLMVYDEPQIGIVGYRVLPMNVKYKQGKKDFSQNATEMVFNNILSAMSMAIKEGSRVINLSLALKKTETASLFDQLISGEDKYKIWMAKVKTFMEKNSNVVFIAAAGNDGKWVDDKVNLQIPCGISAFNLVCVGALDEHQNLASFSNLVLSEGTFVVTLGVEVNSLFPSKMCQTSDLYQLETSGLSLAEISKMKNTFHHDCLKNNIKKKISGTSMASPIVARLVAKLMIQFPELNSQEIIQKLLYHSRKKQLGPLQLNILPFQKPSWY